MATLVVGNVTYSATLGRDFRNSYSDSLFQNVTGAESGVRLTYVGTPTHGTVAAGPFSGLFLYTPDDTYIGTATFDYTVEAVTTGGTMTADATCTLNIADFDGIPSYAIDTQSLYQPVLLAHTEMRFNITRNQHKTTDASNYTNDMRWSEATERVINLATNSESAVDRGGVGYIKYLHIETDNDILVSKDTDDGYWPVSGALVLARTDCRTVIIKNESTTNVAVVRVTMADEV